MAASKRMTSARTSSTRRSTAAACPASSSSSVALRVVIRASVSSLMRAISAFDHSRIAAMSSSDCCLSVVTPSVDELRIASTTCADSLWTCSSVWAWAVSAVARIAADRSTIIRDDFLGAAAGAGATAVSMSTIGDDSSLSSVGVWVASSGRCSCVLVRPRAALKSDLGQAGSAGAGASDSASVAASVSAAASAAGSWERSELHGSRKPERVSVDAMGGTSLVCRVSRCCLGAH